jgi:hypothetical protein
MEETCSFFNKYAKNSKMYYIENNVIDYVIENDEDEFDEDDKEYYLIEDVKEESVINLEFKDKFVKIFDALLTIRTPKKLLNEYIKLKFEVIKQVNIKTYIEMLLEHCKHIYSVCETKKYTKKRTDEIMKMSYSSLDLRLLSYQMNRTKYDVNLPTNVGETFMDVDEISYLKESLLFSRYNGNNKEKFISNFLNYGSAVVTMKQMLEFYLINNNNNIIYLETNDIDDDDPYRFYHFRKKIINKKHWEMDCRLDGFTNIFLKSMSNYLIQLFRKIYDDVFHDNIYRKDYIKSAIIFENDCDQLIQNLCLLCNYKEISRLLRNVVKKNCSYKETKNDVFALRSDDNFLKKELENREKEIDYSMIEMLFDNITADEVHEIYSKNFIKNVF